MLFILVLIVIIVLTIERCKRRDLVKLYQQTGSLWMYLPVIGHAHIFLRSNEAMYRLFIEVQREATGNNKNSISIWIGNLFVLVIRDPVEVNTVLKMALDKSLVSYFLSPVVGNGSIIAPVAISHRRRKIQAATFSTRNVTSFIKNFEANASDVADQFELMIGKGNFSLWDYMFRYSLESTCESTFGTRLGVIRQPNHPLALAFQEYFRISADRAFSPWLHPEFVFKLLPAYKRQNQAKKVMFDFVDNIVNLMMLKEKNKINEDESDKNSTSKISFLELMLKNSKESSKSYSLQELREESLVILIAATDTSATGLCFTLLLLSQHQDVQEKVFKELQGVFGDTDDPINYADLAKLNYMEAVIKEALRLYPPLPFTIRDSDKEILLESGVMVPKKCNTLISIVGIHHDPKYWGEDVDEFKPDRFLSRNISTQIAYMPFSSGPRRCPGNLFAMLSIKTTVATILRRYRLLPATSYIYNKDNPFRINFLVFSKHADNFDIQVESRKK